MTQTNTSANLAAAEESTTDKKAPASCPLNAPYLQLIPVRYAYVENLTYKKTDASKKQIHPTGIRLLRDGWLYVVDTHINRIYEHTLKDGLITARTFKGKLVTDQTRESYDDIVQDKGDEKRLLFKKGHKVYVSYSQVQWSDEKCNQMLKSKERKTFMQEIDLANVSCENITNHLMTRKQAEKHIAEVAEEYKAPEYEVEFDEEKTAYSWTCTEFTATSIGKLTQTLSKEYEQKGNYLFVIVEDYLGMMLDLVQEQRLVSKWLGDWSEKNNNSLKYNVGSYIDSTLTVTKSNATQKGASQWIEGLPENQQQTIYDYINEKIAFEKASLGYWVIDPDDTDNAIRPPRYYEHAQEVEAKRQRIISEQGITTYEEHREEIENIIQNQKEHLDGKGFGGRGINQLAETHKIKNYLKKERPKYNRWQEHLDLITDNRCDLYINHFHMATWYYSAKQKRELLELEEEIMSDLFRNEESIERFSQFLEEKPYYHYPAIQSNFDYKYVAETLPTIVKWFDDTSNYVQATTNQTATPIQRLEELMGRNYWAQLFAETGRTQELQQVRALNLSAAVNRSLDTFMRTLTGPILNEGGIQRFNTAVERYTNLAQTLSLNARAAFLFEIRQVGFVYLADNPLNMANTQKALNTLNNNLTSIRANRQTLDRLQRDRANLQNSMSDESRGLTVARRAQEINRINREITALERDNTSREATISRTQTRLTELISPLREGEGNASIRFTVSAERQAAIDFERTALSAGARAAYGQGRAGFIRAASSTRLPMFLFVFSVFNLKTAIEDLKQGDTYGDIQWLPFVNSITGTISAAVSVWQAAHIALLEHVVERITAQHANLAGANLLSRMGRLNILLGGAGQVLSGISSYFYLYTNFSKWYSAILKGDTGLAISAATSMAASAGNAAIGTYGLVQTALTAHAVLRDIRAAQIAARTVWAVRGAQFATALGRVTPVGIVLTVLQVAGEFAFNYYNTSELQDWFQYCCWGCSNKGWDQIQHNQQLAEALLKPMVIDQGVVSIKGKSYRRLRVLCVGQIQNGVESHPIQWQASWVYANKDDDASALLKQCTRPADQVYPYVAFDWYLPWQEKNEWKSYVHGNVLNIRLSYTPDLATKSLGGEQGVGYLIALKSWDKLASQEIKQVTGSKAAISKHSSLVTYQGEIYE